MNIQITIHASERLNQRLKCTPRKFMKVAEKAWRAREPIAARKAKFLKYAAQFDEQRANIRYRELMGYVFIFAVKSPNHAILNTWTN